MVCATTVDSSAQSTGQGASRSTARIRVVRNLKLNKIVKRDLISYNRTDLIIASNVDVKIHRSFMSEVAS